MRIIPNLRNLFNQYEQEENRLTHSLLHTIAASDKLFVNFLKFAVGKCPFTKKDKVYIGSQGRYGREISTDITKKRKEYSIPDALIHDSNRYCILIENKVTASVKKKQLKDHLKQVRNKFENSILLLLTTDKDKPKKFISDIEGARQKVYWKGWWEIYSWMNDFRNQSLVQDFREYMELLETDIINRNIDWDGMLTKFNGIPFGPEEPYSYERAKWCLNAFVNELKKRPALRKIYPTANTETKGRGAITGKTWDLVWDCIKLGNKEDAFTKHPHLTFVIRPDWTQVQITLPNQAKARYWRAITNSSKGQLRELLLTMHTLLRKGQPKNSSAKLMVEVLHRHYRYQKALGVKDGEMRFDVDSLSDKGKIDLKVKTFPSWLDALACVLANRRKVNFQIAILARYDHVKNSIVGKPQFVEEAMRALKALNPFYDKITA